MDHLVPVSLIIPFFGTMRMIHFLILIPKIVKITLLLFKTHVNRMFSNFGKSVAFQMYIWSFNTFINLVLAIDVHDNLKKDLFDGTFALSIHIYREPKL